MRFIARGRGLLTIGVLVTYAALRTLALGADSIQWKNLGPGAGGNMVAVGVSPADPRIVLMGSDVGGIYRSGDGGQTWSLRNNALVQPHRFSAYAVYGHFEFDPVNSNIVYYSHYKSTDAGLTWQIKVDETALSIGGSFVDPTTPNVVYSFGYANVYRSTDAWESTSCEGVARQLELDGSCTVGYSCTTCGTPAVNCAPGSKCYQQSCLPPAGEWQFSSDACLNYNDRIHSIVVHPNYPNQLLACADTGLYRSTNAGKNWYQINPGSAGPDPLPSGVCYGGTTVGVACTTNNDCTGSGAVCRSVECVNLIQHDVGPTLFMVVKTHPFVELGSPVFTDPNAWLDVNSWQGGLYKSEDFGTSWTSINGTLDAQESIYNPTFDPPLGGDQNHPAPGWLVTAVTTPGAVEQDCATIHPNAASGCSVRIEYNSDDPTEGSGFITENFIPVTGGQLYELSAWHKTQDAEGLVIYAKFWWYKADQSPLIWPGVTWSSTEGWAPTYDDEVTFPWRQYRQLVRPPDDAAYVKISFSAGVGSQADPVSGMTWVGEPSFRKANGLPRIAGQGNVPYFVSYSDIAVDPFDPQIIYTGGLRANVADQMFGADTSGIWKTTDGGEHWNLTTRRQWHDNVQDNSAAVCGDKVCGGGWENCNTCPTDCTGPGKPGPGACCGLNQCETPLEDSNNCRTDCPYDPDPVAGPQHEVDYFYDQTLDYLFPTIVGGNPSYYMWAIDIGRNEPQGSPFVGHNTLFAGANEHLRSTDAGATWQELSSTLYTGPDSQAGSLQANGDATDVFVGPVATMGTRLYYGDTDSDLMVSYNGGKSFTREGWQWYPHSVDPLDPSPRYMGDAVSSIVLDPNNINRIYLGVNSQFGNLQGQYSPTSNSSGGVFQGDFIPGTGQAVGQWQFTPLGHHKPNESNPFPLSSGGIDLIRTTDTQVGTFVASVFGRGVYKLNGNDWIPAASWGSNEPQGMLTYRLYEESASKRLYVGAGDMRRTDPALSEETGIWESSDQGATWCRVSNHADLPLPEDNMDAEPVVDLIPLGPNNLLAATYFSYGPLDWNAPTWTGGGGIYRGTRTGPCAWTWDRVMAQPNVTGLAKSALDNKLLYAYVAQGCCSGKFPGQQAGIYKSTDGGMNWALQTNNGLMNLGHGRLTYSNTNPLRLYASTIGSGLFEGTISCDDPIRDFGCAARVNMTAQTFIFGSLISGAQADVSASSQDDTYVVLQESASHRLRVIGTFASALAGVPYSVRLEGHRTSSSGDTITVNAATRASGTCTGSESYGPTLITVSKTSDDDQVQIGNLGVLPGGSTVFCVQLIDSSPSDSFTDQVTVDRLYLLPHPADIVAAADDPNGPGIIYSGSYTDTQTSNDVREVLQEEVSGNTSLLVHTWRFDNVPAGTSHKLHLEANRPSNPDSDNFQFYYSTNGTSFTSISGALLNSTQEVQGGTDYNIAVGTGGTWYIRVQDTNSANNKKSLDLVNIDHLSIKTVP